MNEIKWDDTSWKTLFFSFLDEIENADPDYVGDLCDAARMIGIEMEEEEGEDE